MSKLRVKEKKQQVLQALVLADDFKKNISPFDSVYPSVLTPVANFHLFDYLIKCLIKSHVQEVFLYCNNHIDLLKSYVENKRNDYQNILISLVLSDGCRSLGDALRDIDTKGIIRGDFILIRGDAFINADLDYFMELHRTKREKDKGNAMTLVLRDIGSTNQSLLFNESCLVVANKQNKRLLYYKKPNVDEKKIKFELEWFLDNEQLDINSGFIDTHVYICSTSVLPLFADNFDFQTMEDFIKGVLMNEEILDSRIYWQSLKSNEYALPLVSWPAYHVLSRDVLLRQAYPLTPENLLPLQGIVYNTKSIYKHPTAILGRGCILEKETIIGSKSIIGKNTKISSSVIGNDCLIGENVKIDNSYILNNVKISDNCIIKDSVLFPSSKLIENNTKVESCILSPNVELEAATAATTSNVIFEIINGKIEIKKMSEKVNNKNNDDDEDEDADKFVYFKKKNSFQENDDDVFNDSDDELSSDGDNSQIISPIPDDTAVFLSEVIDSLLRGYQDKLNCDNLILEINSSRYAYNVSIREVSYNVVKAILLLPIHYLNETKTIINNVNYQKTLKIMISYFNVILLNYIKTEDAQEDCLKAFEHVAGTTSELLNFSHHFLHILYDKDILCEEKIIEWYKAETAAAADDDEEEEEEDQQNIREKVRLAVEPFIKWLNEAEEDSSSGDE